MQIRTDEISSIIRQQIESFDVDLRVDEVGTVLEVGDGIARAYGLRISIGDEVLDGTLRRGLQDMRRSLAATQPQG